MTRRIDDLLDEVRNAETLLQNARYFYYTVKIGQRFSRPQPGCHLMITFPASRESLVSDIPVGRGKPLTFLQCMCLLVTK